MSGVAIIRSLLASNVGLTAVVPAVRITAGITPIETPLPAISVTQISSTQRLNVAMDTTKYLVTERVQVTVQTKTYQQQKSILALVRAALPLSRGTVNGFACDGIVPDLEGPDLFDPDSIAYFQSVDFFVRFTR